MSLKNQIEHAFGLPVRIRAGAPGSLDVYVNGEQIYSKKKAGRFPSGEELVALIRPKIPAAK